MLSFGIFSFFAARIAVRNRGLEFASPPPIRAAIVSSRITRVNTRPRLASVAAFLCLIVAHFECPDITIPRFDLRAERRAFYFVRDRLRLTLYPLAGKCSSVAALPERAAGAQITMRRRT